MADGVPQTTSPSARFYRPGNSIYYSIEFDSHFNTSYELSGPFTFEQKTSPPPRNPRARKTKSLELLQIPQVGYQEDSVQKKDYRQTGIKSKEEEACFLNGCLGDYKGFLRNSTKSLRQRKDHRSKHMNSNVVHRVLRALHSVEPNSRYIGWISTGETMPQDQNQVCTFI